MYRHVIDRPLYICSYVAVKQFLSHGSLHVLT